MTHILHIFKKDAIELLRDRRTLFVNVLLPLLLYPLIMLFLVQVMQLTHAQKHDLPRVTAVGATELMRRLLEPVDAVAPTAKARTTVIAVATLAANSEAELTRLAGDLVAAHAATKNNAAVEGGAAFGAANRDDPRIITARAALLAVLRREHLAAAVIALPVDAGQRRMVIAKDDAHADAEAVDAALTEALNAWKRALVEDRLAASGIDRAALEPFTVEHAALAPPAEAARSRLAAIIPLFLVIMAVSGAFYPALDLIAGERERGTLESLLSWPVRRREIFVGKLLVTCVAAVLSVVLNLASIGLTIGLVSLQSGIALSGNGGAALLSAGGGTLILCFLALLPLTVTLAALSLALAGQAQSSKEAQHYLTPVMVVVMVAGGVAMVPDARPSLPLDLLPITGPVLALKEALRAPAIPWLHIGLSTCASIALAVVVVGWAARLLDSERFCFPGLVRAGWGRFRRWGEQPPAPNAIESVMVYAMCAGGLIYGGSLFAERGAVALVVAPLALFVLMPALVHAWLGAYPPATALGLCRAARGSWRRALVAIPFAVATSAALGAMQKPWMPAPGAEDRTLEQVIESLAELGGLPLLIVCVGVMPGICEEVLCRGTLLHGLRRSLGRGGAVVLSAFLFAVLHLSPFRFVPQFTVGLALGVLALRANSILPGMLLHAGHNAALMTLEWAGRQGWIGEHRLDVLTDHPLALLVLGSIGLAAAVGGFDEPLVRWRRSRALARRQASRARHDAANSPTDS